MQCVDPSLCPTQDPAGSVTPNPSNSGSFSSIEDIFKNPYILTNKTEQDVINLVQGNPHWKIGTLQKGSHKGMGLRIAEVNPATGVEGDKLITHHPGGGHHGEESYWKVSSGKGGTIRVGPQFNNP